MIHSADLRALWAVRDICLKELKDAARWKKEAKSLRRQITNPTVLKALEQMLSEKAETGQSVNP